MSIQKYKIKNGETRYRVQIYYRGSDGKEHVKQKRGFTTFALAKDYEAKERIESKKVGSNIRYREAANAFLDYKETRGLKDRTMYDYTSMLMHVIYAYFGDIQLKSITPAKLKEWQRTLLDQKLSKGRCKSLQQIFKQFLRYCAREGYIKQNPFDYVDYVYPKEISKPMEFYTLDEYKRFRMAIDSDLDLLLFDMLYFTGMRKGELLARKWTDLDINTGTLLINTTWDYRTLHESMSTKTGESRTIYLNDLLLRQLDEWHKKHLGTKYIFQHKKLVRPIDKNIIPDHYNKILAKCDGLKRIRIHDFRHSHVSFLINNNLDSFRIAERLGHSKDMVERRYGHLFPDRKAEILNIINIDL